MLNLNTLSDIQKENTYQIANRSPQKYDSVMYPTSIKPSHKSYQLSIGLSGNFFGPKKKTTMIYTIDLISVLHKSQLSIQSIHHLKRTDKNLY